MQDDAPDTGNAGNVMQAPDDILDDFEQTSVRVVSARRQRLRCCEHVSRSFLMFLLYVLRSTIAMLLASVFAFVPAIRQHVSAPFLMVLVAALNVGPAFGNTFLAIYDIALYLCCVIVATALTYILPNNNPLVAFVTFIGVFAFHYAEYRPATQKVLSAIWILTLLTRGTAPYATGEQRLLASEQLITGLCLGLSAAMIAQFFPPLAAKTIADGHFKTACQSLAGIVQLVGNEYTHSGTLHSLSHARIKAESRLRGNKSVPAYVSSTALLQTAAGHMAEAHLHSAAIVERADALTNRVHASMAALASMVPFVQVERPLWRVSAYLQFVGVFRAVASHLRAARLAFPHLEHAHGEHAATPMQHFRHDTKGDVMRLCGAAAALLRAMGDLPGKQSDPETVKVCQQDLRAAMTASRAAVQRSRERVFNHGRGVSATATPGGAVELSATYWFLLELYVACEQLLAEPLRPAIEDFLPRSWDAVQTSMSWWVLAWSPLTSRGASAAGVPEERYFLSRALGVRCLSALTVSCAVLISLLFSLVPTLTAVFTRGSWASLTCVFCYSTNGGATLRAARDRMLGIFIGTSYAFIVLLILRDSTGDQLTVSPVGITIFVLLFNAAVLVLMQDNLPLAFASNYAVILLLYSVPPTAAAQSSFVLDNFLMTFIGAAIVTVFSCVWFFFNSPRFLLVQGLGATCDTAARVVGGCMDRILNMDSAIDPMTASVESVATLPTYGAELRDMESMLNTMRTSINDVIVEPTLWRPPVDPSMANRIVDSLMAITASLMWLDTATNRFLINPAEAVKSGLLRTSALPLMIAMRESLVETLNEISEIVQYSVHPMRRLPFGWRPSQIGGAQKKLVQESLERALQESWLAHMDFDSVSSRPIIAYCSTLFVLHHVSKQVSDLWLDVFKFGSNARQTSVFFAAQ